MAIEGSALAVGPTLAHVRSATVAVLDAILDSRPRFAGPVGPDAVLPAKAARRRTATGGVAKVEAAEGRPLEGHGVGRRPAPSVGVAAMVIPMAQPPILGGATATASQVRGASYWRFVHRGVSRSFRPAPRKNTR